jgi:hypothetical protein
MIIIYMSKHRQFWYQFQIKRHGDLAVGDVRWNFPKSIRDICAKRARVLSHSGEAI